MIKNGSFFQGKKIDATVEVSLVGSFSWGIKNLFLRLIVYRS